MDEKRRRLPSMGWLGFARCTIAGVSLSIHDNAVLLKSGTHRRGPRGTDLPWLAYTTTAHRLVISSGRRYT
jgi:hypothetical protein